MAIEYLILKISNLWFLKFINHLFETGLIKFNSASPRIIAISKDTCD